MAKSKKERLSIAMSKVMEGRDEIEALQEEMENWAEGLACTNLVESSKYQEIQDSAYALEEIKDELDITLGREDEVGL